MAEDADHNARDLLALLEEGRNVLRDHQWDGRQYRRHVDQAAYVSYLNRALSQVAVCFTRTSHHFENLKKLADDSDVAHNSYYYANVVGLLDAAYVDWNLHGDDLRVEVKSGEHRDHPE